MTDTNALRKIVKEKGIKYKYIAEKLGITPFCLQKKIDNINDFKGKEISDISDVLSLTAQQRDDIFFAKNVAKQSTARRVEFMSSKTK